jgi:hypothetical protein
MLSGIAITVHHGRQPILAVEGINRLVLRGALEGAVGPTFQTMVKSPAGDW